MSVRLRIAPFVLALMIAGCTDRPAPLAAVHGRVTFRGSALPGGLIVFTPDDDYGGGGLCATGRIGADGRFSLTTDRAAGVSPGKYRVTIAGPDGWPLPNKFLDPHLSGLLADVVARQVNVLDFQLEDR